MSGKYKSGAQKRKERDKKDSETAKGQTTMATFMKKPRALDPCDASIASTSNASPSL